MRANPFNPLLGDRGAAALPVVLGAAAFYAAFTLVGLAAHGWNPLWFVWIGERYAYGDPHGHTGFDGQFVYYLARDGWAALPHLDNPPYRLQRILYPILARTLSGGDAAALPWVMVAINGAAILAATLLITRWLIAHGQSRWWGLVYPLYVGTLMSYSRDLTEPLAYAFAAGGAVAWFGERRLLAVACFALAGLARETTALFPLALALAELMRRRWSAAATLAAACTPMLAWQLYIAAQLGALPVTRSAPFSALPGTAMFARLSLDPGRLSSLLFVALPVLALTPSAVRAVGRARRDPIAWLVAVHCAFVILFPAAVHAHILDATRGAAGLLVALLLGWPRLAPAVRAAVALCAVLPTAIWLAPMLWWAPWTAKM
jgi:hypothetical protein